MVARVCRLLCQLPATAVDIFEALPLSTASLQDYRLQDIESGATRESTREDYWLRSRVTHHVNDLVLCYALHGTTSDLGKRGGLIPGGPVADFILALLKLVLEMSAKENLQDPRELIVCAYL